MIYNAHKRIFGFECNPFQVKRLAEFIDNLGMDEQLVVHAMERAGKMSHRYIFKLIVHLLDRYHAEGILKMSQVIELGQG
ncbi:Replication initiation and membrane attachment [compost metagenome]